jgi:glycosyltransferase involved in cell wall biosynthesis
MKKILMVAFHYPPFRGSSGIQRTLKFCCYLPDYDWQPIILTANPKAYPSVGDDQLHKIHKHGYITRAFALDTARYLSIGGSYLKWMSLPDRWVSWWPGAVLSGLRLVRQHRPQVIWSTYPIATAHLIGLTLQRLTGIPWVADFRDPMTDDDYPHDPATRSTYRWIERRTVKYCTRAVFTTPGAARMYAKRYPEIPQSRWVRIANGYDEESFNAAEQAIFNHSLPNSCIMLVHSGVLYPSERDPSAFFAVLAELRRNGKISSSNLKIILRGTGNEDLYRQQLRQNGIEDIVFLGEPIPYHDALVEMLNADGLLIFQASNCNHQIPAKVYEYLRANRPIFAMTDQKGDTADLLKSEGIDTIVSLDSKEQIAQGLLQFLIQVHSNSAPIADSKKVACHSRNSRTQELVRLLNLLNCSCSEL